MVEWMKGVFIPIIELVFIGAIGIFLIFVIVRAFLKIYKSSMKWFIKYSIMRKSYNAKTVEWVLEAIGNGLSYWDARKLLLLSGVENSRVDETCWIYNKINNKLKGGNDKNGQRIAGSNRKVKSSKESELPNTSNSA